MATSRTPRIYVGTYRKYNNFSIEGKWLDLSDYSDLEEFYEACRDLHKNESDPEFMFQDWEDLPDFMISESSLDEQIFEYLEAMEAMDDTMADAFDIFVKSVHGNWEGLSKMKKSFEESYQGYFGGDWTDAKMKYTHQYIDDCGYLNGVPEIIQQYFNYEAFSRDLFMTDMDEEDGHIFSKNY